MLQVCDAANEYPVLSVTVAAVTLKPKAVRVLAPAAHTAVAASAASVPKLDKVRVALAQTAVTLQMNDVTKP